MEKRCHQGVSIPATKAGAEMASLWEERARRGGEGDLEEDQMAENPTHEDGLTLSLPTGAEH